MTDQTWTLSSDEFAWLWTRETDKDAYGYPDPILVRETARTTAEYERVVERCHTRFARPDNELSSAFAVMSGAELRVRCFGSLRDGGTVRSHGAATATDGAVVFQRTDAAGTGGEITLVLTSRHTVPVHIAATMPPTPAGRASRMVGYTPRVRGEEQPSTWRLAADGRAPVEERIRSLMRAPRSAEGQLVIERGYRHEPPRYLSWIDISEGRKASGRYLVDVDDNDVTVTPVSMGAIVQMVSSVGGFDRAEAERL
ncbi:ESX secretion-associated protein EspG [Nocardia sp. NPDC058658]|uniref:ESX secretion-associated protein EspG n=1 Tax=Nocardia sp. NPDC058658 TaxID=3346580 RepID=UPI003656C196